MDTGKLAESGLSPRVRGNQAGQPIGHVRRGSIPAGAGEPSSSGACWTRDWVYPRGCGGTVYAPITGSEPSGLSPRVRGNQPRRRRRRRQGGSIPAGAGEPPRPSAPCRPAWVYPRGCGGTGPADGLWWADVGLSPRVRGNRRMRSTPAARRRSIPAGAGEPAIVLCAGDRQQVYPRGCGGTRGWDGRSDAVLGLSPRVRGNRTPRSTTSGRIGSIPAGAGEPSRKFQKAGVRGVYPRGCGGTEERPDLPRQPLGLSPRVRGNHRRPRGHPDHRGSIPAGAGEPSALTSSPPRREVYPRGCGGTYEQEHENRTIEGLSPRVRGNRGLGQVAGEVVGSIPAGAGEPPPWRSLRPQIRVYPRGCGGTAPEPIGRVLALGLSPRVRGNRLPGRERRDGRGSIPAGAGEPRSARPSTRANGVYPRGCGGTWRRPTPARTSRGLSPRVRGNRARPGRRADGHGSIPAGAGEPSSPRNTPPEKAVYPRGCGGTTLHRQPQPFGGGLSPRVRGNLAGLDGGGKRLGSIPAGAGEPRGTDEARRNDEVYPRGCGGTRRAAILRDVLEGLSPRVRGNRQRLGGDGPAVGSIPAGAGEPACSSTSTS